MGRRNGSELRREAVFWLLATYGRCQRALSEDAPGLHARFDGGLRELLRDLGIDSRPDLLQRGEDVRALLPDSLGGR